MIELKPLKLVAQLDNDLVDAALSEVKALTESDWKISKLSILNDRRKYISITDSPLWVSTPYKSGASSDSVGTFQFCKILTRLPNVEQIIFKIKDLYGAKHFGQVYLSKMELGSIVHPHIDRGPYYLAHHRIQIALNGSDSNADFCVGGEIVNMKTGECWCFQNKDSTIRYSIVCDVSEI
jgi:hypothetical protein